MMAVASYFAECMTGFEYQVGAHCLAEGLLDEGLTIVRPIYDRYHPSKRNPFNEIACSDHYARAMASYACFLTVSGFRHSGPDGMLGFAPTLNPDSFRSAFTAAEGWGGYQRLAKHRVRLPRPGRSNHFHRHCPAARRAQGVLSGEPE